jgi:hypothetical protein
LEPNPGSLGVGHRRLEHGDQALLPQRQRAGDRRAWQRTESPVGTCAAESEGKAPRHHQGQHGADPAVRLLAREHQRALPVLALERGEPAGVVVHGGVGRCRYERVPPRISRFHLDDARLPGASCRER